MFPIIFEGIVGRDAREGSSPSFFNIDEATCVKRHCLLLIGNRKMGIRALSVVLEITLLTSLYSFPEQALNILLSSHPIMLKL